MKTVVFFGDSKDVIRGFPNDARSEAGYQLENLQNGLDPNDWKPMRSIGKGVREIRIRDDRGAFRIIYTTVIKQKVSVLHAFQKKSQQTSKRDLDLARRRLKEAFQYHDERSEDDNA